MLYPLETLDGLLTEIPSLTGELSGGSAEIVSDLTVPETDGSVQKYEGEYTVVPQLYDPTVLPTMHKKMMDDVIVTAIPITETTNPTGGLTVLIG